MPNPKSIVTNHPTQITTQCWAALADNRGYAIIAHFNADNSATLPTTTSQFASGCVLISSNTTKGVSTTTAVWINTGSPTTPTWTSLTIN